MFERNSSSFDLAMGNLFDQQQQVFHQFVSRSTRSHWWKKIILFHSVSLSQLFNSNLLISSNQFELLFVKELKHLISKHFIFLIVEAKETERMPT